MVQAWHVIFLISGFFDSLFLADSGGEEQEQAACFSCSSPRKKVIGPKPPTVSQAFVVDCGEAEAYHARRR